MTEVAIVKGGWHCLYTSADPGGVWTRFNPRLDRADIPT